MSIQWNKVGALLRKDFKDAMKNAQCLLLVALPLFMVLLYRSISFGGEHMDSSFVFTFGLLMNLSMLPLSFMSMMIAEEKEKFTLRTLMLSNVTAADFLISKTLVVLLIAFFSSSAIYFVTQPEAIPLVRFLLVTPLALLCLTLFGALIGILSKNQMATGMYSAPAMLLFLLPPTLAQVNEGIASVARFIPTQAAMELLAGTGSLPFNIAVMAVWAALGALLFGVAYRKKRLD